MADPQSHSGEEPNLPAATLEEIFHHALELGTDELDQYLARACGNESALRAELESLLSAHQAAEGGALLETRELKGWGDQAAREVAERVAEEHHAAIAGAEQPGDWIGRYRLLEPIGEGGFGTVWMAEQRETVRRRVALKVIKPGMDTLQVIARFEQERQALALMGHPNIARVFDAGSTPAGRPYFVMELVRGIRITDYCDKARLPTEERLRLFLSVCDAVQHAHQKGIIHRDLKPSNILVTLHDGVPVPKVIDFGVAKATRQDPLTELTLFTRFDEMIGTPLYMSPEQAEMSGLDVDTRSDIYSLGVLLYELMTGRTPIDPDSLSRAGLAEVRRIIREGRFPRPSALFTSLGAEARTTAARNRDTRPETLLRGLHGDLDWIVMKALERDRNRRYESAHLLAADLQRHLAAEPVTARPPSAWYRFQRFVRRNKATSATAAAVTFILLATIGFSVAQAARAEAHAARTSEALSTLRATAPSFEAQARTHFAEGDLESALDQLDYSIRLQPGQPRYQLAKADLLMAEFQFAEAGRIYRSALALDPKPERSERSAALCERLLRETADGEKPSNDSVIALHALMRDDGYGDAEMPRIRSRLAEITRGILSGITGGDEERFGEMEDGTWRLNLCKPPGSDLSPLRGLPISDLVIHDTLVSDLEPLAGMPLDSLQLHYTRVEDFSPLRGAPLRKLWLPHDYVGDISFLLEFEMLEQLHLPDRRADALSLMVHPSLKRVSAHNPEVQPAAHFFAGELIRKGRYREAQSLLEKQTASESNAPTFNSVGLGRLLAAHGDHQDLAGFVRARIKGLASLSNASTSAMFLAGDSLLPNPPALPIEEIGQLLQMAESESTDLLPLTQGLFAYRKGEFEKVIEILDPHYMQMEGTAPGWAAEILAMARCRLGDLEGADKLLAEAASAWPKGIDSGWMWHNWMVHDQLRREAGTLLEACRQRYHGK